MPWPRQKADPERARADALAYYYRNREAVLARRKARRVARTPEQRALDYQRTVKWRKTNPRSKCHGLSKDQVAVRLAEQGGACGICGDHDVRHWHGDHDHATGNFRAVLCNRCNLGLGLFRDDAARCRQAADYLDRHKQLGELL